MVSSNLPNGPAAPRPSTPPLPRGTPGLLPLGTFARRVIVLLLILTLFLVAWQGIKVLLEAFAGALFAVFLFALAEWVRRYTRLRYGWALAVVIVGLLIVAGGVSYVLWSRLANEVGQLTEQLPKSLQEVQDYLKQYPWGQQLLEKVPSPAQALSQEASRFTQITGLVTGVAHFLEALIVIVIVGIFGAGEPDVYRAGLLHVVPRAYRARTEEAVDAVLFNLRGWLVGQVALMILMWIATTLGLWLIGVPLALALGFIAGVMELVPYIGPILSAIPALLIALLVGPSELLLTAGLYLLLHILEGYIFAPLIQRRAVHLAPALTLTTQVLLGNLLGILGLFAAAPLTVVLMILTKMLYVEDTLGDPNVNVPGEPGNETKEAAAEARA
jgi:predicted PurR-regulated permease PerM